jgi:hypothetical protein
MLQLFSHNYFQDFISILLLSIQLFLNVIFQDTKKIYSQSLPGYLATDIIRSIYFNQFRMKKRLFFFFSLFIIKSCILPRENSYFADQGLLYLKKNFRPKCEKLLFFRVIILSVPTPRFFFYYFLFINNRFLISLGILDSHNITLLGFFFFFKTVCDPYFFYGHQYYFQFDWQKKKKKIPIEIHSSMI